MSLPLPSGTELPHDSQTSTLLRNDRSRTVARLIEGITSPTRALGAAIGGLIAAAAPPVIAKTDSAVASNAFVTPLKNAVTSGNTYEISHIVCTSATDLTFEYGNFYLSNSAENDGAGTLTVKASVVIAGVVYPLKFNGAATTTILPGGKAKTDPLGVDVAAGDIIRSRTYVTSTSELWATKAQFNATWGDGLATGDQTAAAATALTGTVAYYYGPQAIRGATLGPVGSICVIGDSIMQGLGETGITGPSGGENVQGTTGGWVARAFRGVRGYLNVALSGDQALLYNVVPAGHTRRAAFMYGHTVGICGYGRNDITNGRALPVIQADLIKAWRTLRIRGQRVYQTTITPNTTSTDAWATVANQTVANSAAEAVRVGLNTWLRAGAPVDPTTGAAVAVGTTGALVIGSVGHPLVGIVDITSVAESGTNSGLWAAASTNDGLHPNTAMHTSIAVFVKTLTFPN